MKNYKELLAQVTTFVFDVDGVLTDGSIMVTTDGQLLRRMGTKDGYALKKAADSGFHVCIISGGKNEGVRKRLEGLGINDVYLGIRDKIEVLNNYLKEKNTSKEHLLYMGDDIPDLEVMKMAGLPACPQDAVQEIKAVSKYISHKRGGRGCVRDVVEQVLKVQGRWP